MFTPICSILVMIIMSRGVCMCAFKFNECVYRMTKHTCTDVVIMNNRDMSVSVPLMYVFTG